MVVGSGLFKRPFDGTFTIVYVICLCSLVFLDPLQLPIRFTYIYRQYTVLGQQWLERRNRAPRFRVHLPCQREREMQRKSQRHPRKLGVESGKHFWTWLDSIPKAELEMFSFSCGECHRRKQKVHLHINSLPSPTHSLLLV